MGTFPGGALHNNTIIIIKCLTRRFSIVLLFGWLFVQEATFLICDDDDVRSKNHGYAARPSQWPRWRVFFFGFCVALCCFEALKSGKRKRWLDSFNVGLGNISMMMTNSCSLLHHHHHHLQPSAKPTNGSMRVGDESERCSTSCTSKVDLAEWRWYRNGK